MKRALEFLFIVTLLAGTIVVSSRGQTGSVTVTKGQDTPELIPDARAYAVMFASLLKSPSESDVSYKRRRTSYIQKIGLDGDETEILIEAVEEFKKKVTDFEKSTIEVRKAGPTEPRSKQLQQEYDEMVKGIADELHMRLGPVGEQKLRDHIWLRVKPRITIWKKN